MKAGGCSTASAAMSCFNFYIIEKKEKEKEKRYYLHYFDFDNLPNFLRDPQLGHSSIISNGFLFEHYSLNSCMYLTSQMTTVSLPY